MTTTKPAKRIIANQTYIGKKLKIIPLSGLEEIGKNCTILEYGDDIIVIDLGLMFPNEEMPGVDYVVPDISYLQKNKRKIKGIIITHGHMDHTGAIPYLIKKIDFPTIYTMQLTAEMIKSRLEEFKMEKQVFIKTVDHDDQISLGAFDVSFFRVNHNIPDSMGIGIKTPLGYIIHTGDYKFDHTPVDQEPTEFHKIAKMGGAGVLALLADSTNSEMEGFAVSEKKIGENINDLFGQAKGRLIFSTFASLISRQQQMINASMAHNRKIAFSGYSLEKNIEIAVRLGYLKVPSDSFVPVKNINNYPDNKITIICTGAQGQESSALGRISKGEHRDIRVKKGDLIVLSSSPIPGNERSVQNLMDSLFRLGARVVYNKILGVHVSGHAYQEEQKIMLSLSKPRYFIPIHGQRYMLEQQAQTMRELGMPEENIMIMSNGQIAEFIKDTNPETAKLALKDNFTNHRVPIQGRIAKEKLSSNYIMVDGLGVGDVGNIVLRDRQLMSQDGMFVVIVTVDNKTLELIGSPDIISRGFVYLRESKGLLLETRKKVRQIVKDHTSVGHIKNWSSLKTALRDEIGTFLFHKTERRPMILPVVIEV
ncbi:MAG: ribonuclease J [Candidatus Jacksonbacteria bacterium]